MASPSYEEYEREWDSVREAIVLQRSAGEQGMTSMLAQMDMSIHTVQREDGTEFLRSRRDSIPTAAKRGDLGLEEYVAFLNAMGEKVVWPED
ncbi:hypothetical protein AB4Y77_11645 [Paenarthrobacter sp. YAF11_1]|uniref:hypothetical protein n=1 Tax=Paenarthrobacter sp. YAF11_1 TaxID=3233074 RepID=UPI003F9D33F3